MLRCAIPGFAPLCWDTNDPSNTWAACAKRLLRPLPTPDPEIQRQFFDFCRKEPGRLGLSPLTYVMTYEEWEDSLSFNEARKEQLRAAAAQYCYKIPPRRKCQHIDSFGKTEPYDMWKYMRMINSRCDAFKAYSGRFFKSVENVVYHDVSSFIKHVPVPDRRKLIARLNDYALPILATDFTAYESHFTKEVMDGCECALYRYMLKNYPQDAEFICHVITGKNKMRTRSGFFSSVEARRMSGDMCTSLGNGWTNLMLARFIAKRTGHALHGYVEGDDGIFATGAELTEKNYQSLGFSIKVLQHADARKASFCGLVFADDAVIRNPRHFLNSFSWSKSFINAGPRICDGLLRGKALSALYETPQCPIIGVMARVALQLTDGITPIFELDGYHKCGVPDVISEFKPSTETRALFAELYGITEEEQIEIEYHMNACDWVEVSHLIQPHPDVVEYSLKYVESD